MIYLDNAATTKPFKEVIDEIHACQTEVYGNPSSTHSVGRKAKVIIEQARKSIAKKIGVSSSEIIFTSGGTEADNIFLRGIIGEVKHVISNPIEHPAVRNTLIEIEKEGKAEVSWLEVDKNGNISFNNLSDLLQSFPGSLVVLMHGNNEIGNRFDLSKVAKICEQHKALFFTDAVQTMGHYTIDAGSLGLAGLAASAHKFHGPKGAGFLYLKKGIKLNSVYTGGEQERNIRVGTENVAGIAGMSKALELCYENIIRDTEYVKELKEQLIKVLLKVVPGIQFLGLSADLDKSLNSVLSASFPPHPDNDMLLFKLDMAGVAVSAGSACASGAQKESHVMQAIGHPDNRAVIRFSLSRMNTTRDVDTLGATIKDILDNR